MAGIALAPSKPKALDDIMIAMDWWTHYVIATT